jgi:hypothetical protein
MVFYFASVLRKKSQNNQSSISKMVTSQKVWEDIGGMRVSFLKVAKPCFISLNGGLALKFM